VGGGRFPAKAAAPYIGPRRCWAASSPAACSTSSPAGKPGFDVAGGFASNGYGEHSPGGYSLVAALVTEVVMTMAFLIIILGATDKRAPAGFAPIAIGLG
jgi:aquaporin Z